MDTAHTALMSVETEHKPESSAKEPIPAAQFADLSESELDALIDRVEQAKCHNMALSAADLELLLGALLMLANMQERLHANDLSIHKLKKLLGIVRSSEKYKDLFPADKGKADSDESSKSDDKHSASESRGSGTGRRNKPPRKKRSRSAPIKPVNQHHPLEGMVKGDACPGCLAGKVYKYNPAVLVRVTGHAPLSSERHLCDRLRCNACGEIFTAELPAHVKADGRADQMYGFSARSAIAIYKYFAGTPFYRQESMAGLLGGHVAASTMFDQCEKVANALNPVFKALKLMAAQAPLFYLDDTTNRILGQQPVLKIRDGKQRLRSGIYTSAVLAITDEQRRIVLLQTNVGHAGEWMSELLGARDPTAAAPMLMSDALSSNHVTGHEFDKCLCNAHGRRGFADLAEQHPHKVAFVLEHYQHIWINETHCTEQKLSAQQRLDYHWTHSLPRMQALHAWCTEQLDSETVEHNSNLGKAMQYFVRHYEGLIAFCRYPGAPLDNNEIERLIKLVVRARRNSLFFKTLVGADISDVITSILATCHEHNVNAFAYLNAIQRNQLAVRASPAKWLPWNYPVDKSNAA